MKTPFFHEEIEVKKQFITVARELMKTGEVEKQLASVMLYANIAEYLAHHLRESLRQIIFSGSKSFWNGQVYLDLRDMDEKATIGQIARDLKSYSFPSKDLIIKLLEDIAQNRNTLMHKLLRTPSDKLGEIDKAMATLVDDAEELIQAIDDIYRALPPKNITEYMAENGTGSVEAVENNEGEITIQEKEEQSGHRTSARNARKKAS